MGTRRVRPLTLAWCWHTWSHKVIRSTLSEETLTTSLPPSGSMPNTCPSARADAGDANGCARAAGVHEAKARSAPPGGLATLHDHECSSAWHCFLPSSAEITSLCEHSYARKAVKKCSSPPSHGPLRCDLTHREVEEVLFSSIAWTVEM